MSTPDTNEEFKRALALCRDIFSKKLYDYKPSWRMLRPSSLTDQLFIKAKRIRTLEVTGESLVGEGILPEFMALINYGIVGLIQLEKGYADKVDMTNDEAMALYDHHAALCVEQMEKKKRYNICDFTREVWSRLAKKRYTSATLHVRCGAEYMYVGIYAIMGRNNDLMNEGCRASVYPTTLHERCGADMHTSQRRIREKTCNICDFAR